MKVPCIICLNSVEVKDKNILATLCDDCKTDTNIKYIGTQFNKKDLDEVLRKFEHKPNVNDFGEVI